VGVALIYASLAVEFAAFAAIFALRRPVPRALLLTAVTMLGMFLLDISMIWMGQLGIENLWLINAGLPFITALILWSFSYLQTRNLPRDTMRIAAGLYILVWLIMSALVDDLQQFSRFTGPLQALVVLVAAGYTLVSRVKKTYTPLWAPWFWISLGWILYFGSGVVLEPVSRVLLDAASMDYLRAVYYVKAAINILAYALLTMGVLCGRSSLTYGGSFSQPPAPSRS
jgi:hypothetical protein